MGCFMSLSKFFKFCLMVWKKVLVKMNSPIALISSRFFARNSRTWLTERCVRMSRKAKILSLSQKRNRKTLSQLTKKRRRILTMTRSKETVGGSEIIEIAEIRDAGTTLMINKLMTKRKRKMAKTIGEIRLEIAGIVDSAAQISETCSNQN